jgi:hypothetical protein
MSQEEFLRAEIARLEAKLTEWKFSANSRALRELQEENNRLQAENRKQAERIKELESTIRHAVKY